MLNLEFRFPAGKYHATPWDRQVNEGIVEWPASPWRILRALISTWYWKAQDEIEENTIRGLVEKLGSSPEYRLPNTSLGHTRHYMPLYRVDQGKSSKIFDTFAAIDRDDFVGVSWHDIVLSDIEVRALDILLERMGYLGRAESWIEAKRHESDIICNCSPIEDDSSSDTDVEIVKILVPLSVSQYVNWRRNWIEGQKVIKLQENQNKAKAKGTPIEKVKLSRKDIEKIEAQVPADIFEALQVETTSLKKYGWSQPPGSQWVSYTRPADCFRIKPASRLAKENTDKPTVARYAIASQSPPRLTDAISVADRVHVSLVKYSDGSSVFTGCDGNNQPLKDHRHAHIFLESNLALGKGKRGDITHVTIYSPRGFGCGERQALDRLTKIWGHGGHDLQLILLGVGKPADFAGNELNHGQCPLFCRSSSWISRTPFIPTRHPKATRAGVPKRDDNGLQIGSPEHEVRRLLRERGFPEPLRIDRVESIDLAGHETRWLHFRRERKQGEGRKSTNMGYGFKIEFEEEVSGPIAIGYGCHFGLGLFVPDSF